jgi:Uma2 family endonuclease
MNVQTAMQPESFARPWRMSVDEFIELTGKGWLANQPGEFELHDGVVIHMNAKYLPHVRYQNEIAFWLYDRLKKQDSPLRAYQEPSVRVDDGNSREPDIAVLDPETMGITFVDPHSIKLLVEVAYDSHVRDFGEKMLTYARMGTPEYWVVDLVAQQTTVMRQPGPNGYGQKTTIPFDQPVTTALIHEPLIISTLRV